MTETAENAADQAEGAAAREIDAKIAALGDWRGATLARVRGLILGALPGVIEEIKWRGVPVWSHQGILCTGEVYKSVVKLTFARGAALADPEHLFNSSLDSTTRRAIDIPEGGTIDAAALQALIRAAAAGNADRKAGRAKGAGRGANR